MGGDYPPVLTCAADFRSWKLEVEMWVLGTGIDKKKQAAVCIGRIKDRNARDRMLRLDKTKLGAESGMTFLLTEMSAFYKEDETQSVFLAIDHFEKFERSPDMGIHEYISEFSARNAQVTEQLGDGPGYHDGTLAYRLIKQANLSEDQKVLIKAAMGKLTKPTYETAEEALKRCFGDRAICVSSGPGVFAGTDYPRYSIGSNAGTSGELQIKQEPVYYAKESSSSSSRSSDSRNLSSESSESVKSPVQSSGTEDDGEVFYNNNRGAGKSQGYQRGNPYRRGYQKNTWRGRQPSNQFQRPNPGWGFKQPYQKPKGENNPIDKRTGKPMRCLECDSTKHLKRDCPHNESNTLLQSCFKDKGQSWEPISNDLEYTQTFMSTPETLNKALIDTGAVRNVCGESWLKGFIEALPDERKEYIQESDQQMTFRFGDGHALKSIKHVNLPVYLCGKPMMFETFVVAGDLPLLFARQDMKKMGVSIDILNDKIMIGSDVQDLTATSSGHIAVDLIGHSSSDREAVTLFTGIKDPKKVAIKLHSYFGHPSAGALLKLVNGTKHASKELENAINNLDCEHCVRYKRDPAKPRVSIWSPGDVNEVIAMDLKFLKVNGETLIMFHVIDLFSRFSLTKIIPNKTAETVLKAFFEIWIVIMGRPKCVLFDNGGEFCNQLMTESCEDLGISIKTTGANSPWSNGMCERHNGIIANAFYKLLEELPNTDPCILLAWATNGKNSLANTYGQSPYTLVFGRIPSIPSLDQVEMITTLNESTVNKVLADHLNSMYQARTSFVKANNDEKIRRALKARMEKCLEQNFIPGDKVLFKRENLKRWCGPATVIGQDGKVVFLRQGGTMIRLHSSKCVLASESKKQLEGLGSSCETSQERNVVTDQEVKATNQRSGEEESVRRFSICSVDSSQSDDSDGFRISVEDQEEEISPPVTEETMPVTKEVQSSQQTRENSTLDETDNSNFKPKWEKVKTKQGDVLDLEAHDLIRYREKGSTEQWTNAQVTSLGWRTSSSNSRNKNHFNISWIPSGDNISVKLSDFDVEKDCSEVDNAETGCVFYIEDETSVCTSFAVNVPKSRYNEPKIQEAMDTEMEVWRKYKVFHEVPDTGQSTLSTRWVVTQKSGDKFKARLVIRGFEEVDETAVDSPTGDKSSTRIIYSLAASYGWTIETVDIKGAFLQSEKLDRTVFVKPPRNLKKVGLVWQLDRPAYGLKDSSRNWYNSLSAFLKSIGFVKCKTDDALFYSRHNSNLIGIMLLHVDDFLICGNTYFKRQIIPQILTKYDISKHKIGNFVYTGVNVTQNDDYSVVIDQYDYANQVKCVQIDPARARMIHSDLTPEENTQYRSLLGKLSWLSNITRPDLKWDVYSASRKNKNPTVSDLKSLNKVVSKLNTQKSIKFPGIDLKSGVKLVVHSDASFGNIDEKVNSGRGYVIFLCSGNKACVLVWASNKIKRVVRSTKESEALALLDALDHAEMLRDTLSELFFGSHVDGALSIVAFIDSKVLYDSLHSTKTEENHRLRRDLASVKERLALGQISEVRWVPTTDMLADPLTKEGANPAKLDAVLTHGHISTV